MLPIRGAQKASAALVAAGRDVVAGRLVSTTSRSARPPAGPLDKCLSWMSWIIPPEQAKKQYKTSMRTTVRIAKRTSADGADRRG